MIFLAFVWTIQIYSLILFRCWHKKNLLGSIIDL